MKRPTCYILCLLILLSLLNTPVLASSNSEVQPRYTYITTISASISVDTSTGLANCRGIIHARNQSVMLVCKLQKKEANEWTTIKTWVGNGYESVVLNNNYAIFAGYTYRVLVSGYVKGTNNNIIEQTEIQKMYDYS